MLAEERLRGIMRRADSPNIGSFLLPFRRTPFGDDSIKKFLTKSSAPCPAITYYCSLFFTLRFTHLTAKLTKEF